MESEILRRLVSVSDTHLCAFYEIPTGLFIWMAREKVCVGGRGGGRQRFYLWASGYLVSVNGPSDDRETCVDQNQGILQQDITGVAYVHFHLK